MRKVWVAVVAALGLSSAVPGATINYVADNGGGEYCGVGYGISVSVSAPQSGAAVKYAESSEGPWLDALTYKDVCSAKMWDLSSLMTRDRTLAPCSGSVES